MSDGWRVVVAAGCELGEHPVWDAASGTVVWVDLPAGAVHRSTPPASYGEGWHDGSVVVAGEIGVVALRADGGLIAAADSAFLRLDASGRPDGDPFPVDLPAGASFNDGACDPAGRFLAGTTSAADRPGNGVLWSLDPSGSITTLLEGIVESNGLGWSLDGSVLYYVDSGEPVVRRYSYDCADGSLGPRLADLAVVQDGGGVPDGLVVDADGAVWVALWEGGAVRQYAADGTLLAHLHVPVSLPTCPGFAGADLDQLVVTSAWQGLAPAVRADQPWAGHLLVAPVSVRGLLPHRFGAGPR